MLALIVLILTVTISVGAGLAFRRRFFGSTVIFYMAVASLVMPGLFLSLGIGLIFRVVGIPTGWYSSALGAQLTWTLPFGLLIMFAVLSRFNRSYEEAAHDLWATNRQVLQYILLPILLPGLIAVALFAFTLSYDEFPRTLLTVGPRNSLPLEIYAMTTTVTSPALYALGTVTTVISLVVVWATNRQVLQYVLLPILLPGLIAVALFAFTLSYDEFPRTLLTVGPRNSLPLEIYAMTTTVTSPALYALGTVTTAISFVVIILSVGSIAMIQRRRAGRRRTRERSEGS